MVFMDNKAISHKLYTPQQKISAQRNLYRYTPGRDSPLQPGKGELTSIPGSIGSAFNLQAIFPD
jgi:hypothetical protein